MSLCYNLCLLSVTRIDSGGVLPVSSYTVSSYTVSSYKDRFVHGSAFNLHISHTAEAMCRAWSPSSVPLATYHNLQSPARAGADDDMLLRDSGWLCPLF